MIDYETYQFTKREVILYSIASLAIVSGVAYLFYQSITAIIVYSPVVLILMKIKKQQLIKKRKWQLNIEFKEGITSISAALSIGYSMENAIREATQDLTLILEKEAFIIKEFQYILSQIEMNIPVEQAFLDFSNRANVEDITNFVDVFITAKRSGGDLIQIIQGTTKSINDKLEIKREIQTLIAGKQLEGNIMSIVPLGIILYMWICSPGYLQVLYHNTLGIVVMTTLLGMYLLSYWLLRRIVTIQV